MKRNDTMQIAETGEERADYLDMISGLMILHMIVGHILQHSGLSGTGTFYDGVSRVLFFFMPWFYFKAGLFIRRKRTVREWVERDVRRLIVPFIIFSILGMILYVPFEFLETDRVWWKILGSPVIDVLRKGSLNGNLALWFLLSLFFSRLAYRLTPERYLPHLLVVSLVIGNVLNYLDWWLPLTISTVFPGIVFILLGYYSKPHIMGEKLMKFNGGGSWYSFCSLPCKCSSILMADAVRTIWALHTSFGWQQRG